MLLWSLRCSYTIDNRTVDSGNIPEQRARLAEIKKVSVELLVDSGGSSLYDYLMHSTNVGLTRHVRISGNLMSGSR